MVGPKTFQEQLIIKYQHKKQKSYYYIQINSPFFAKQYFVGKINEFPGMMDIYHQQTMLKVLRDMLKFVCAKEYSSKLLSKRELLLLDLIRIIFFYHNQFLSSPETDNRQKRVFQTYVHGSTSIEGNTFSLQETELTLYQSITPTGKTRREFYEIDNYRRLQTDPIMKKENITKASILRLHEHLMKNILSENIGEYRRISVAIHGSDTSPSPPPLIDQEMNELIEWYNDEVKQKTVHPLEIMLKFHSRFEQIHPFIDGNGRVGRELLRWQAKKFYFPLFIFTDKTRQSYLTALYKSDNNELGPLYQLSIKLLVKELETITKTFSEIMNSSSQVSYPKKLTNQLKSELTVILHTISTRCKIQERLNQNNSIKCICEAVERNLISSIEPFFTTILYTLN